MNKTPTPRTSIADPKLFNGRTWVTADFARTLERELTAANQRIAELEKDEKRLEWAIDKGLLDELVDGFTGTQDTVRTAIDQAMSAKPE